MQLQHLVVLGVLQFKAGCAKVHVVSFADQEPFLTTQAAFEASYENAGASTHRAWNTERIRETHLFRTLRTEGSKLIAEDGQLVGFWWKPLIILDALQSVPHGDWVIYHDSSRHLQEAFRPGSLSSLVAWLEQQTLSSDLNALAVRSQVSIQWEVEQDCLAWTWSTEHHTRYRDPSHMGKSWPSPQILQRRADFCDLLVRRLFCPVGMHNGMACCEAYLHAPRVSASWMVWRTCPGAVLVAQQWLNLVLEDTVLERVPFADMTVLGLLWHYHSLPTLWIENATLLAEDSVLQGGGHEIHTNRAVDLLPVAQVAQADFRSQDDWSRTRCTDTEWAMSLCYHPQTSPGFHDRLAAQFLSVTPLNFPPVAFLENPLEASWQLDPLVKDTASQMMYRAGASALYFLGRIAVNPGCPPIVTYDISIRNSGTEAWPRNARWVLILGHDFGVSGQPVRMVKLPAPSDGSIAAHMSSENYLTTKESQSAVLPGEVARCILDFDTSKVIDHGHQMGVYFMKTANSLTDMEMSGFGAVLQFEVEIGFDHRCPGSETSTSDQGLRLP